LNIFLILFFDIEHQMDSVIEKQRRLHEECERLETAITKELSDKTRTHKEKILKESRIAHYLDLIFEKSTELLAIYADKTGERQADIDALRVGADMDEFYRKLRAVKDNYKINPEAPANMVQIAIKGTDKQRHAQEIESKFTGEENFGKTLDLNELHTMYINLKGVEHVDYLTFLDAFDKFDKIPQQTRTSGAYKTYVDGLLSYLRAFITKSQPLLNLSEIEKESMQEFETTFTAKTNDSSEELFCEACCRTFAKQTVFDSHLNGKKHKAAAAKLKEQEVEIENLKTEKLKEQENRNRSLQEAQHLIGKFVELLAAEIQETKEAVERKQTLTLEEFEARGVSMFAMQFTNF
jgi:splicing factor 3A subunit 3